MEREASKTCSTTFPGWRKSVRESIERAEREVLGPAVAHLLREVREAHADLPEVLAFLDAVERDVLDSAIRGTMLDEEDDEAPEPEENTRYHRYQVKLLVDHSASQGAPVVFENNPGYGNLIGRIEHVVQQGNQVTHFNLIRAGALHRANGGYLVLDAERLLSQPFRLGRPQALPARGRDPHRAAGRGAGLERRADAGARGGAERAQGGADRRPRHVLPADGARPGVCRAVQGGGRFRRRHPAHARERVRVRAPDGAARRGAKLLPVDRSGVARLVEEASRLAEDAGRLSLNTRALSDLMREADYHARQIRPGAPPAAARSRTRSPHARGAPTATRRGCCESILEGTTLISTDGAAPARSTAWW
jgi:hypothetical protein